ncbi:hypothetical protein EXN32_25450 [Agrobacterium tumefaciens]|nr:hypothetical protein EXN32_25450 [Agrobacterium tumefaciens]
MRLLCWLQSVLINRVEALGKRKALLRVVEANQSSGTYDEKPARIKTETPKSIIHRGFKGVHIVPSRLWQWMK